MKKFFQDTVGKMTEGFGVYQHLNSGYEVRAYQQKLIQEVKDTLNEKGKCVLGATCGSGKTHITIQIIEDFLVENPDAKVLILTHGRTQLRSLTY
jgi:superfamily II DNA or RNA helicase